MSRFRVKTVKIGLIFHPKVSNPNNLYATTTLRHEDKKKIQISAYFIELKIRFTSDFFPFYKIYKEAQRKWRLHGAHYIYLIESQLREPLFSPLLPVKKRFKFDIVFCTYFIN